MFGCHLSGSGRMSIEKITPILNVSDIGASFEWFEKPGWQRSFSWNDGGLIGKGPDAAGENEQGRAGFGGVCVGDLTLFLCCGAQGSRGTILPKFPGDDGTDGVWMTWWLSSKSEVNEMHALAVKHDMFVTHPPVDEPWGVREFHLRHPDGHTFRVSCGLDSTDD